METTDKHSPLPSNLQIGLWVHQYFELYFAGKYPTHHAIHSNPDAELLELTPDLLKQICKHVDMEKIVQAKILVLDYIVQGYNQIESECTLETGRVDLSLRNPINGNLIILDWKYSSCSHSELITRERKKFSAYLDEPGLVELIIYQINTGEYSKFQPQKRLNPKVGTGVRGVQQQQQQQQHQIPPTLTCSQLHLKVGVHHSKSELISMLGSITFQVTQSNKQYQYIKDMCFS